MDNVAVNLKGRYKWVDTLDKHSGNITKVCVHFNAISLIHFGSALLGLFLFKVI